MCNIIVKLLNIYIYIYINNNIKTIRNNIYIYNLILDTLLY